MMLRNLRTKSKEAALIAPPFSGSARKEAYFVEIVKTTLIGICVAIGWPS
jgi:hypothetical protein